MGICRLSVRLGLRAEHQSPQGGLVVCKLKISVGQAYQSLPSLGSVCGRNGNVKSFCKPLPETVKPTAGNLKQEILTTVKVAVGGRSSHP